VVAKYVWLVNIILQINLNSKEQSMKKIVTFGEIMLRLSPPGWKRFSQASSFEVIYGGGESNVAVSLANYGLPVDFVTRLPENDLGDCALMEMRKRGVNTQHIIRGGERLGIYFLETGAVSRGSKVVYDRAHSAISTIQKGMIDWEKVFEGAQWFHWTGITPAISQGAADACLEAIQVANKMGITVSTDLCKKLMEKFPRCKKVIVTLRGSISASHNSWSGVLYDGKKLYEAPTYQITDIVDRVGGGDSFMGGLICGLLKYKNDDQKALDFAVAASCLKHTIFGDANLATIEEVEKLMGGDASGRVSR